MKFYLFNFDNVEVNDPSELTNEEFKDLAKKDGGYIFDSAEDFESAFNAEIISTATHQLRIVENDNSDRERKIAIIKRIIEVWGETTVTELELDHSPCLNSIGNGIMNVSELVEEFMPNGVNTITYHDDMDLGYSNYSYDELPDEIIDEIYQIMLDYEEDQAIEHE